MKSLTNDTLPPDIFKWTVLKRGILKRERLKKGIMFPSAKHLLNGTFQKVPQRTLNEQKRISKTRTFPIWRFFSCCRDLFKHERNM